MTAKWEDLSWSKPGMFSPEAYRSASGRILGRWTTPRERFGLCSVFGGGPHGSSESPRCIWALVVTWLPSGI